MSKKREIKTCKFNYGQSIPVEVLVQNIADQKQGYTQFGGLRPYGVSFIFAGWYCVFALHFYSIKRVTGTVKMDFNYIKVTLPVIMSAGR